MSRATRFPLPISTTSTRAISASGSDSLRSVRVEAKIAGAENIVNIALIAALGLTPQLLPAYGAAKASLDDASFSN